MKERKKDEGKMKGPSFRPRNYKYRKVILCAGPRIVMMYRSKKKSCNTSARDAHISLSRWFKLKKSFPA